MRAPTPTGRESCRGLNPIGFLKVTNMISKEFAEQFAAEWIASWNSHDLDRILAHYAEDVTIDSPTALKVVPQSKGFIAGKENIRSYWQTAMQGIPDLEFRLLGVFRGVHGVALHFLNVATGITATEVMNFNEARQVCQVLVYHAG